MKKSHALLLVLLPAFALASCGTADYATSYNAIKEALDPVKALTEKATEGSGYSRYFNSISHQEVFTTSPYTKTENETEVQTTRKITSKLDVKVNDGKLVAENGVYQGSATIDFVSYLKDTKPVEKEETTEETNPEEGSLSKGKKNGGKLVITATLLPDAGKTYALFDGKIESTNLTQNFKVYNEIHYDFSKILATDYKSETFAHYDLIPAPQTKDEDIKKAAEPETDTKPAIIPEIQNTIRYLDIKKDEAAKDVTVSYEYSSKARPITIGKGNDLQIAFKQQFKDGLVYISNANYNRTIINNKKEQKLNAQLKDFTKTTYITGEKITLPNIADFELSQKLLASDIVNLFTYFAKGITTNYEAFADLLTK